MDQCHKKSVWRRCLDLLMIYGIMGFSFIAYGMVYGVVVSIPLVKTPMSRRPFLCMVCVYRSVLS